MMKRRFGSVSLVGILAATSTATAAEPPLREPPIEPVPTIEFRAPVELEQGALIGKPRDGRFTGAVNAVPALSFYNRVEVGLLLSGLHRNPHYDFGLGGRVQGTVYSVLQNIVAFRLGGQLERLFYAGTQRVAGGVIANAANLVHLALWSGWDVGAEQLYFTGVVGVNICALGDPIGAILRVTSMEDMGNGSK